MLLCECLGEQCLEKNGTSYCETTNDGFCFAYMDREDDGREGWLLGCLPGGPEGLMQCKGGRTRHHAAKSHRCCSKRDGDFCNSNLVPDVEEGYQLDVQQREAEATARLLQNVGIVMLGCSLLVLVILLITWIYRKVQASKKRALDHEASKYSDSSSSEHPHYPGYEGYAHAPLLSQFHHGLGLKHHHLLGFSDHGYVSSFDSNNSSLNNGSNVHYGPLMNFSSHMASSNSSNATQHTILHSSGNIAPVSEDSGNSGTRGNFLVEKTISQECELLQEIGKGRYSRVYKARLHQRDVAVKIYMSRDQLAFNQEIECFEKSNMKNRNLLAFVASDFSSRGGVLELWMISDFHKMGSLRDYLHANPIRSVQQMMSIFQSIIDGLNHLHTLVIGSAISPGIAHRDLKSTTILMQSHNDCCIGDFSTAVISTTQGAVQQPVREIAPSPRYMAPEVLNRSILAATQFSAYRNTDIYSLGLIYWEILNRLEIDGQPANPHQLPFEDMVAEDVPEVMTAQMRTIVCEREQRPAWNLGALQYDPFIQQVRALIGECYAQKPGSRLPTLKVKTTVMKLRTMLDNNF